MAKHGTLPHTINYIVRGFLSGWRRSLKQNCNRSASQPPAGESCQLAPRMAVGTTIIPTEKNEIRDTPQRRFINASSIEPDYISIPCRPYPSLRGRPEGFCKKRKNLAAIPLISCTLGRTKVNE